LIAHILYYFSEQNDLVFDPMGGGGVTPDTCLAFNRRCWTLDMIDRPDSRPEIEPFYWGLNGDTNLGVLSAKEKPDLIIFDPPYFDKKAEGYAQKSISMLPREKYLNFFERFGNIPKLPPPLPLSMQTGGIFSINPPSVKLRQILSW
jgi:DNA modification methylase